MIPAMVTIVCAYITVLEDNLSHSDIKQCSRHDLHNGHLVP